MIECPACGSSKVHYIRGRRYLQCNECGYVFKAYGCPTCGGWRIYVYKI